MRRLLLASAIALVTVAVAGCGDSAPSLTVGQTLTNGDGSTWGTILELSDSHTFSNGETEPGALVQEVTPPDVRAMEPQWYPQDSLERSMDKGEQSSVVPQSAPEKLAVASTPTPEPIESTEPETNGMGETPDEEQARLSQERETKRQMDIDYHQGKLDELETERARLVASLNSNASPDVVLQSIQSTDRQIKTQHQYIATIRNQR